MNELQNILSKNNLNISSNPIGTDKGDFKSYIDLYYSKKFSKFKNAQIKLLEIGIRHGASIKLWTEYFQKGEIYGVDDLSDIALKKNNQNSNWLNHPRVKFYNNDAYSIKFVDQINFNFDLIIDDGPHSLSSQLLCCKLYLPKLHKNGYLIIEDILRYGRVAIIFFLFINLKYQVKIYDFRDHKPGNDNLIIEIHYTSKYFLNFCLRLIYFINSIFNLPIELIKFFKRKAFK